MYMEVIEALDVRRLSVHLLISSKITGRIIKVRHMDKACVVRRDNLFCSLEEMQVFGKDMQRNYQYGVYSYRVVVTPERLPPPGIPTPTGMPLPYCWASQNFDVTPTAIPADLRASVQQQVREDLLIASGAAEQRPHYTSPRGRNMDDLTNFGPHYGSASTKQSVYAVRTPSPRAREPPPPPR
ncbi:hypothetical protein T492DRAFT_837186 [Pavlovales sp. CCMP2436]|nr:hypothetical protein T492DRAFT_837186 [Pavlovales sp. CCMP2436]